jgi:ribosomal protein S18 acetylase RimI-like enzyme
MTSEPSLTPLQEFASFIAPLQQDPTSQNGMIGNEEIGIVNELEEFDTKLFFDRDERGGILGVAGFDYDEPLSRGYIYGPWVSGDESMGCMGRLFDEVMAQAPAEMETMDTAFNKLNADAERFATERGFELVRDHFTMTFEPEGVELTPDPDITEVQDPDRARVMEIHERCFEGVWPTGPQLFEQLEKAPEDRRIFVLELDGAIAGYHYATVDREVGEGFVDNIGVDEAFRGRGVATRLLSHGLAWMFGLDEITRIELSVREENQAALKVYEKAGFERSRALRQMRLRTTGDSRIP